MPASPLSSQHLEHQACFTTVDDWQLPLHYGDPKAEYRMLRYGFGLIDLSNRGLIRVAGRDRERFLNAMLSNNTADLEPGQGCYATFLNAKGHMVTDLVVYAEAASYLLEVEPHTVTTFLEAIDFFVISEDVTFAVETGKRAALAVQGPKASDVLAAVSGQEPLGNLAPYGSRSYRIADHEVWVAWRSYTREPGYLLIIDPAAAAAVWATLRQQGEAFEGGMVGLEALNTLRIESGTPRFGVDMTEATIPIEANLQSAISYTKGCYVGQEVIARIDARGHVNRQLVGLLLGDAGLPEAGARIYSPEREVGWITSATQSPTMQQTIALGYVRRESLAPGTALQVRTDAGHIPATVSALPFSDP
jgi:glycine cleavage system T protein